MKLSVDTPRATTGGATFTAPANWSIAVNGFVTVLEAPEPDLHIALVDAKAANADAAVTAGWAAYRPEAKRTPKLSTPIPARKGWDERRVFEYETSPNERAIVSAIANRHADTWTVVIVDGSLATFERRGGQIGVITDTLRPKGYQRETFAGRKANTLDAARVQQLRECIETAQKELGIPGVALSLMQGGKVVFEAGFGVRELGKPKLVNADTLFMIGSNTKALSTLMLAKLVDQGRFRWDTPVTSVYPAFKLGDPETTKLTQVKHLVCACTGMPRQDFEFFFHFKSATPESEVARLGTMQPTTKFGEVFQYSNLLAAMAGYVGAHVLYPDQELGAAYDKAMRELVFTPLGMKRTTFDFDAALRENHASPYSDDVDGHPALVVMALNRFVVPVRPAGAAWASAHELARYVAFELARGRLPNGQQYVSEENLLARRVPNVAIGKDATYGMGLVTEHTWGVQVVHHGGGTIGYVSDMLLLPDQDVGAVILTNSTKGGLLLRPFMRRLLEVLFDGQPEAVEDVTSVAKQVEANRANERKRLVVPADPKPVAALAPRYVNAALGKLTPRTQGGTTVFDFGEWQSAVATRKNDDGTISFITLAPGGDGFEFVVADKDGKRALVIRDAQHEYISTRRSSCRRVGWARLLCPPHVRNGGHPHRCPPYDDWAFRARRT